MSRTFADDRPGRPRHVEVEARFFYPPRWYRIRERLTIELPKEVGDSMSVWLPPPVFSLSAAHPYRLIIERTTGGLRFLVVSCEGSPVIRGAIWRETALWSQVTFEPWIEPLDARGPWWFRWRTLNADHDLLADVVKALNEITDRPDDPMMVSGIAAKLRREIYLDNVDAPVFREVQR